MLNLTTVQEKFLNEDEIVLYGGGLPTRGHYNWVMKRFLELKMTEQQWQVVLALVRIVLEFARRGLFIDERDKQILVNALAQEEINRQQTNNTQG